MRSRFTSCLKVLVPALALFAFDARASLIDEIQVYTDDINKPHEFGLEMHVNTTPYGNKTPAYPGEVVSNHGLRITPEFSYGLSHDFEAGLYLPLSVNNSNWSLAGYKLRLKWLPLQPDELNGGFFAGANGELSNISSKFEASRYNFELRTIFGYRNKDWLLAVNPVFGAALSSSQESPKPRNPGFEMQYKVSRTIVPGIGAGFEYYNDKGSWNRFDPSSQQGKALYYAMDITRGPLPFNFGIGRGLNGATDKWTLKFIFEVPI